MPKKTIIVLLGLIILFINFKKIENDPKINTEIIKKTSNFYSKNSSITVSKYFIIKEKYTASVYLLNDNFRVMAYKKNNLELDTGCDEKYFWYWDSAQSTMYYSDRNAAHIVFNQVLDPCCFLNLFNNEPGILKINDKKIFTMFDGKNTVNKEIFDSKENLILKACIIYEKELLKEIVLFYAEDNISMKIEIKDVVVNEKYDNNVLKIPINSEKLFP